MKRNFLFAIFMVIQSLWIATDVLAMELVSRSLDKREQRLSSSLNQMFGVDIKINGDVLTFKGPLDKIEGAISKLNDFNQLRQNVIPVSTKTIFTQACPNSKLTCWQECLDSLGIQQDDLSNFAIKNQRDEDGCLKIPYGQVSGELTFNQKLANMYVDEVKSRSAYFGWMSRCNKQLIQTIDDYLVVNYGLLTEYLCSIEIQPESTDSNDVFVSQLSLQSVLKRLTAAAGGDISLVGTSIPGQYQVRTVMLGNDGHSNGGSIQTIEIVIDQSGSMAGDKINSVNQKMPIFLRELRGALIQEGQSLNVEVYAFSDNISRYNTYTLIHSDHSGIPWKDIGVTGGTDLTKVGDRLKLSNPDERKVVVAFTDGEHASTSDLNASLETVSKMQHEGCFAQPYFCRVGLPSSNNTSYFSKISSTFSGSFYEQDSIEEFCKKVTSNIPYLLESNIPLILTVDGVDITIRQQDAKRDIHTTTQEVRQGDSIMHQGIRGIVSTEVERLEAEEIKRLEAQLAELKLRKK
jgi:uncharacterized protein YegL